MSDAQQPPLLEVTDLATHFHARAGVVKAVDGVSFSVLPGTMLALIGPNGAGKTTCFNMLNGQLRPDGGEVLLAGRAITGLKPRHVWRMGVGRTFQITATFTSMTVRENVQMALISHAGGIWSPFGRARDRHRDEADGLLAQVGMLEQAERACGVLAYGDLKRVELAVALANRPRLLLMDEPTAGMAPRERIELMALTAGIATATGIAVLFTEPDSVIVLDRGRLIAHGTAQEVRQDPNVRAVYLGSGATSGGH